LSATPPLSAKRRKAGPNRPDWETGGAVASPPMQFQTLGEAERAAAHLARTDPTARLCGGVGVVQELSCGLYRLVTAPRSQSPARGRPFVNPFGQKERLVAYVACGRGREQQGLNPRGSRRTTIDIHRRKQNHF